MNVLLWLYHQRLHHLCCYVCNLPLSTSGPPVYVVSEQAGRYAADVSPRPHSPCTPARVWKGVIHDLHVGTGHPVMESFWMWKMSSTLLFNEAIMCFPQTVSSSAHTGGCCQALLQVGRLHTCSTFVEDNKTKRYWSCKVIPGYLLFA